MMTEQQRKQALADMSEASSEFYRAAVHIGNHPFIEFTGLMNEYIKACADAHKAGIDFSECNTHSGKHLPLHDHQVSYLNEKLECIFTGRSVIEETTDDHRPRES